MGHLWRTNCSFRNLLCWLGSIRCWQQVGETSFLQHQTVVSVHNDWKHLMPSVNKMLYFQAKFFQFGSWPTWATGMCNFTESIFTLYAAPVSKLSVQILGSFGVNWILTSIPLENEKSFDRIILKKHVMKSSDTYQGEFLSGGWN